jgi:hypothetical protein
MDCGLELEMPVKTWLQKLTDESSLWFNAIKAEDDGDPVKAAEYYLMDAKQCLKEQAITRAALSCSCAANCMVKTSNSSEAMKLYHAAGEMYRENAEKTMGNSIREALWSLQEAYENFVLSEDNDSAQNMHDRYVSLATRISPFFGVEESLQTLGFKRLTLDHTKILAQSKAKAAKLSPQLQDFIEEIVNRSQVQSKNEIFDPKRIMGAISADRGSKLDEKSIVS